ncbi:MAG: hypothetical protein ACI8WB_005555 [Phenylobacterium sp.]|jgi:hypothetical protein
MKEEKLEQNFQGDRFRITHCKGALVSFEEAISHLETNKRQSFKRAMVRQIQRLADGHRMSKENFPQEGELPKKLGQRKAKKFNALKKIPVRGYCWLSEICANTYFISHYVYKNYDKLKPRDTTRVGDNWVRIEVNHNEC